MLAEISLGINFLIVALLVNKFEVVFIKVKFVSVNTWPNSTFFNRFFYSNHKLYILSEKHFFA